MAEVAKELLVRYAVIVITSHENSTKNTNLLANVVKIVSSLNIRLSIIYFTENEESLSISEALLLAQKRPSVFFVLGNDSKHIFSEVVSIKPCFFITLLNLRFLQKIILIIYKDNAFFLSLHCGGFAVHF